MALQVAEPLPKRIRCNYEAPSAASKEQAKLDSGARLSSSGLQMTDSQLMTSSTNLNAARQPSSESNHKEQHPAVSLVQQQQQQQPTPLNHSTSGGLQDRWAVLS